MARDLNELAAQIKTSLRPRVIQDDFDRGYAKAIDRVLEFLADEIEEG